MAVAEKLNGTRSGSIDTTSGVRTIERHFYVTGTSNIQTAIAEMDASVPPFSSTYQVGTMLVNNVSVAVTARYYGSKSWSKLEGETEGWEFVLKYTTNQNQEVPPDGTGSGVDIEWITTQGSVAGTSKNLFRAKAVGNSSSDPDKDDIGGELIDAGGQPTTVTWTNWTFTTTVKSYEFPELSAFADLIGKRNSTPYEGADVGEVLYLGFSWSKDSGSDPTIWTVTHNFSVDKKQYHAEQVAKTDSNGDIILKKDGTGESATTHAAFVYWVQPFEMANFNALPDF
tara:strand:+ start:1454 stop:2305 length:852 start_codon:yes stop_codon:yes gene_type:complete